MNRLLQYGELFRTQDRSTRGAVTHVDGVFQCAAAFIRIPFPSPAVARNLVKLFKADGNRLVFSSELDHSPQAD